MLKLVVAIALITEIFSKSCQDLTESTIRTYVFSDTTDTCKVGLEYQDATEVSSLDWYKIENSQWIWCKDLISNQESYLNPNIKEFSKKFWIFGDIVSASLTVLVDDVVTSFRVNGLIVDLDGFSSYSKMKKITIKDFLVIGLNSLNFAVEKSILKDSGGISYLIEIESKAFV